jgi:hypothetical protein
MTEHNAANNRAVWIGFVCGDCGRGFRWSHRCRVTGARFTTHGRVGKDREPFGMKASGAVAFHMPSSQHIEV